MLNRKRLFESTIQTTSGYYSTRHGYSYTSEVAELVDRTSVTVCNKQTDRWRAPITSLRQGGDLHTAGVLMPSAVDGTSLQ